MRWRRSAGSACRRSRRWWRSARRAGRSPTCSISPPARARRILNRRLLEALIKAGALDRLHANRRQALEAIDLALRYGAAHVEQATSDQASLFGSLMEQPELPKPRLPEVADLPELERLQQEFEALGCYLTAHPLEGYRAGLARLGVTPSDQLALCGGLRVKLAGVVLGKQERSTARSRFAFVQLSDPSGVYEVTLFAELLGRVRELLESNQPLLVEGEVRLDGDLVKVQAASVTALDAALANGGRRLDSRIEIRLADAAAAGGLADLLGPHGDGSARVRVVLPLDPAEEVAIELGEDHRLAWCAGSTSSAGPGWSAWSTSSRCAGRSGGLGDGAGLDLSGAVAGGGVGRSRAVRLVAGDRRGPAGAPPPRPARRLRRSGLDRRRPRSSPARRRAGGGAARAGDDRDRVRLLPGAVPAMLRLPASELRDRDTPLTEIWGPGAAALSAVVGEQASVAGRQLQAEAALIRLLAASRPPDRLIAAATGWLARHPTGRVERLARVLEMASGGSTGGSRPRSVMARRRSSG